MSKPARVPSRLSITIPQMVKLVRDGLATATPEPVRAGKQTMEVARVRITDAGRQALARARQ